MKKLVLSLGLVGILVGSVFGSDSGESWSRLYRRLSDIKQKYAVLQNITPLDDRSLEPFLTASLDELVYGDLSQYREQESTYDDWEILCRTLVRELGEIKGQSSAETIWKIVETAEVPLLKAEALVALGHMRSIEYAPEIAILLRNLNFNVRDDKEQAEIEAFGAVVALEKMKEDIGFEPLFYASIGWYSDRVASLAAQAVLTISDNPTEHLSRILVSASDYSDKRKALSVAMTTDAPVTSKMNVAVVALEEGLRYAESDSLKRGQLANLRSDAITAMINFGVSDPEAPKSLNKAISEGDIDEKLIAIQALGIDGSDEATEVLVTRMAAFNERQASGLNISREEQTIVRQLIFALGETGNEKGLQPLSEMEYIDYTPALLRQSKEAIAKIEGN